MMPNRFIRGKRAGFPFFIERNNDVIIFPNAQWKVRVNETDSVFFIEKNIQSQDKKSDMVCKTPLFQFFNQLS